MNGRWVLAWTAVGMAILGAKLAAAADAPTVIRSAKSGNWSSAETWENGAVPKANARVLVRPGHAVTYDVASDDVIRAINIAGQLMFATDRSTVLNVGLIKIDPFDGYSEEGFDCEHHADAPDATKPRATLAIGSQDQPLPAEFTATIRLHAVEGLDKQSCPAIVCCAGQFDLHGAPLSRTWVKLGATAKAKDDTVKLADKVTGWRAGDRIIITATKSERSTDGTRRPTGRTEEVLTEERTIKAIDGDQITLSEPLKFAHLGEGNLRGEVANLSRNVIIESANPAGERGHTMYHRDSAGSISYAEFRHLGKENVLGRYALHFHQVGNTMRGSSVVGASIWDSHNRWLTIHGTNYLVVRDNVGYQSVGHGFFMEDGTEIYNVLYRNLAVQAYEGKRLPKQVLPFDSNEGAGFWWTNCLNTFTRNVAVENDRYGYRFEATVSSSFDITSLVVMQPDGTEQKTDVRKLPFVRFDDNEAHCNGRYGMNLGEGVRLAGPDTKHPFVMRNLKIWEEHYAFRVQSPTLLSEGMHIEQCDYGIYHPNYDNHVYRNLQILYTETEPFNRGHDDDSVQHGSLTVDGLTFASRNYGGSEFIQISDHNPTGKAESHFRNVKVLNPSPKSRRALVNLGGGPRPTPKTPHSVPVYIHDHYGPGKHALVESVKDEDVKQGGDSFRQEPPLTGDQSRVKEVTGVEFPELLAPVDDLPPQTIITQATRSGDKVLVRGTVADNGEVRSVNVNGLPATLDVASGLWQIELALAAGKAGSIVAHAVDAAGNVEKLPHAVVAP